MKKMCRYENKEKQSKRNNACVWASGGQEDYNYWISVGHPAWLIHARIEGAELTWSEHLTLSAWEL